MFVWALNLQALRAFLFPKQGREAADSTISSLYASILLPLCLHPPVSCLLSAALCGHATSETLQTTKVLAAAVDWPVTALTMGTTGRGAVVGGSGADGGLVVGIFYAVGAGRRVKVWLNVAIVLDIQNICRDCVALCDLSLGSAESCIFELFGGWQHYKTMKPLWKKKWHFTVSIHGKIYEAIAENFYLLLNMVWMWVNSFLHIILKHFVPAVVGRRLSYHPT